MGRSGGGELCYCHGIIIHLLTHLPTYSSASSNEFTYKAVKIWDYYRTKLDIHDFEIAVNAIRYKLKSLIESIQNAGNPTEWSSQNFCHIPPAL